MGFKSVYGTLKELFPQVDARLLKAVAIEHSKDLDAAVEAVLTDVIPYIGHKSDVPRSAVENNGKTIEISETIDANKGNDDGCNVDNDSLSSSFYDAKDTDDLVSGYPKNDELILFKRCEEASSTSGEGKKMCASSGGESSKHNCNQDLVVHDGVSAVSFKDRKTDLLVMKASDSSSYVVGVEDGESEIRQGNSGDMQLGCTNALPSSNPEEAPCFDSLMEQPSAGCNLVECEVSAGSASKDQLEVGLNLKAPLEAENDTAVANDIIDLTSSGDTDVLHDPESVLAAGESETLSSTIVTRSGQICRVSLLEDIIEEARNYKDTVFSSMESVLKLMEEVELQEKKAEQVKVAAARGGLDILERADEIKNMLKHAREANEMHAGEVYGEKSILATEVRELQARLFGLSDEKDKSLSVLDEMRRSLEERLAVAEQQRRVAEQEMCDKQENARVALAEQELIMDKVVQESKVLQQEAEENAKLRDFLMEKGRVVDVLQGEVSVICQDVKSLKESFDSHSSLSKSLSIEQTSCRLASSNSSVKSMASLKSTSSLNRTASLKSTASLKTSVSDPATEQMDLPESPARMSQASSVDCQSPKSNAAARHGAIGRKQLSDDDWELCDMI